MLIFLILLLSCNFHLGLTRVNDSKDESRAISWVALTTADVPWLVEVIINSAVSGTGVSVSKLWVLTEFNIVDGYTISQISISCDGTAGPTHTHTPLKIIPHAGRDASKNAITLIKVCPPFAVAALAPMPTVSTTWAVGAAATIMSFATNNYIFAATLLVADESLCTTLENFDAALDFCTTADPANSLTASYRGLVVRIDSKFAGFNTVPSLDGSKPEKYIDVTQYIAWMKEQGVILA